MKVLLCCWHIRKLSKKTQLSYVCQGIWLLWCLNVGRFLFFLPFHFCWPLNFRWSQILSRCCLYISPYWAIKKRRYWSWSLCLLFLLFSCCCCFIWRLPFKNPENKTENFCWQHFVPLSCKLSADCYLCPLPVVRCVCCCSYS